MNKKYFILIFFSLVIIIMISFFSYNNVSFNKNKNYIAINIDGKKVQNLPTKRNYKVDVACFVDEKKVNLDIGVNWNNLKNRWYINFNQINLANFMCEINFVSSSNPCEIPGYLCFEIFKQKDLKQIDDLDGTSYYFLGTSNNNYLRFANLNWRIMRINGDNSIRLILAEYAKNFKEEIVISYNNEAKCLNPSSIKESIECSNYKSEGNISSEINSWYQKNISGSNKNFVVKTKYCNDLANYSTLDETIFGSYIRNEELKKPNLKCENHYETDNSNTNIIIDYVGLISFDESYLIREEKSYLEPIIDSWTMSPRKYYMGSNKTKSNIEIYMINGYKNIFEKLPFAPVISLNQFTLIEGNGTKESPYLVISVNKP